MRKSTVSTMPVILKTMNLEIKDVVIQADQHYELLCAKCKARFSADPEHYKEYNPRKVLKCPCGYQLLLVLVQTVVSVHKGNPVRPEDMPLAPKS